MELKEKAVSKKQQRFFGMVRAAQKGEGAASPEVAKVAGEISKKDAKDFAKTKHKGLPEKKKIQESPSILKVRGKRNTSLVATGDHRRDKEGNIKASFYKKKPAPQGEKSGERIPVLTRKGKENKSARYGSQLHRLRPRSERLGKKKVSEGLSTKDAKKLNKASALSHSDDPKDQDRARARQTEVDYKDLLRQLKKRKKMKEQNELAGKFKIDTSAHKKVQKKAKLRNLAKGNTNPNEKAAAEKKAGGPKLIGEVVKGEDTQRRKDDAADRRSGKGKLLSKKVGDSYAKWTMAKHPKEVDEGKTFDSWKKAAASALGRKKEEKKPQKDMSAGGRSRRVLQRREYAAKVSGSEDIVPDEIRN